MNAAVNGERFFRLEEWKADRVARAGAAVRAASGYRAERDTYSFFEIPAQERQERKSETVSDWNSDQVLILA